MATRVPGRIGEVAPVGAHPEGTTNLVLVIGRPADAGGRVWLGAPARVPDGATGWIPRDAVGGTSPSTRSSWWIACGARTLTCGGRDVMIRRPSAWARAPRRPAGEFYVRNAHPVPLPRVRARRVRHQRAVADPHRLAGGRVRGHPRHGPARAAAGAGVHGCIRLRNADILRLDRLMPVGTPLTIV